MKNKLFFQRIFETLECRSGPTDEEQFKISIWDFAGHDLYQSMHHIFLNAKAIYLLCFNLEEYMKNADRAKDELRFWLNSIAAHKAHEPAVLIVGTHADNVDPELLTKANEDVDAEFYDKYMSYFVFNKEDIIIFPIDNSKGPNDERVNALKQEIQYLTQQSCNLVSECRDMLIKWLHCEKHIHDIVFSDISVFSMTRGELHGKLESTCGPIDRDSYDKMLEMFHDCGIVWLPGM